MWWEIWQGFIASLLNLMVKEFWKSAVICKSYERIISLVFFDSQCRTNSHHIDLCMTLCLVHTVDKTRLSLLVRVDGVNRIGNKSRLSVTVSFETVLSSLEMQWGLLKTVLTCHQFCWHHRQDSLVLSVVSKQSLRCQRHRGQILVLLCNKYCSSPISASAQKTAASDWVYHNNTT